MHCYRHRLDFERGWIVWSGCLTRWLYRGGSLTAAVRHVAGSPNAIHPLEWLPGTERVVAERIGRRGPLPRPLAFEVCRIGNPAKMPD